MTINMPNSPTMRREHFVQVQHTPWCNAANHDDAVDDFGYDGPCSTTIREVPLSLDRRAMAYGTLDGDGAPLVAVLHMPADGRLTVADTEAIVSLFRGLVALTSGS